MARPATTLVLWWLALTVQASGCGAPPARDRCAPNPCANGGTCTDGADGFTCACAPGFDGETCAHDVDDCTPDPCVHGICSDGVASFSCACAPGYDGARCDRELDECAPNPCLHDGTCTDLVADFSCSCAPGWSGKECATNIDDCTPDPCAPGGSCIDGVNGFTCDCGPGFEGPTCAINLDDCTANACMYGGTCVDGANDFSCLCPTGTRGKRCQIVVVATPTDLSTTSLVGRACADAVSYSVVALDAATAQLAEVPADGCLASGDELLLINLRGVRGQVANVGNWELVTVGTVAGDIVNFAAPKTRLYGDDGGDANIGVGDGQQRVVVQRVPHVEALVVEAPLTTAAWDGLRGGVLALRATGDVTLTQPIDLGGKGYRGGATNGVVDENGVAGESIAGEGARQQAANEGGGGGGLGDGDASDCATNGRSGGGGGHGSVGGSGSLANGCGGAGGAAYGDAQLARLFLGSGGGAGGMDDSVDDNPPGGAGGAGGGIVLLIAGGRVSGSVIAGGAPGVGDPAGFNCPELDPSTTACWDFSGAGGGGAGGSVLIEAMSFAGSLSVSGGAGGNANDFFVGDGGAGASGLTKIPP